MAEEEEALLGSCEPSSVVRLFVGGLGASVTDHDLEGMIGTLGRVHSVEIVRSKDRDFAYVEFETGSAAALHKLFSTYNGCKWKGGRLRVEKAKEHYLSRLQREWATEEKIMLPKDLIAQKELFEANNITLKKTSGQGKRTSQTEGLKIYFPKTKKVKFIPNKGLGKHKRSFQRVQSLPLCLLTICSCKEHEVEDVDRKTDLLFQHEFERSARVMEQLENRLAFTEESQQPDICIAEAEAFDGGLQLPSDTIYPPSHQPHASEPEHRKVQVISRSRKLPKLKLDFSAGKSILNMQSIVDNAIELPMEHVNDSSTPLASLCIVPENILRDPSKSPKNSINVGAQFLAAPNNWEKVFKAAGGNQLPSSGTVQGAALHLSDDDQIQDFSKLLKDKALIEKHTSKTTECMDAERNAINVPLLNTRGLGMLDFNTSVSNTACRNPDTDHASVTTTLTKTDSPESKTSVFSQKELETQEVLVPELCNKVLGENSKWVQKASWKSLVGETGLVAFSLKDVIGESHSQLCHSRDKDLNSSDVKTIFQSAACLAEAKTAAPLGFEVCKPSRFSGAVERSSTKKKNAAHIRQPDNYLVKGGEEESEARVTQDSLGPKKLEGFLKKAQLAEILKDESKYSSEPFPFKTNLGNLRVESESHPVTHKAEVKNGSPPCKDLLGRQFCSFMRSPNAEQEWLALRGKLKADYKGKHKAAMRRMNASMF